VSEGEMEGESLKAKGKNFFTLFFACKREGDPAKRRSGESTMRATPTQLHVRKHMYLPIFE